MAVNPAQAQNDAIKTFLREYLRQGCTAAYIVEAGYARRHRLKRYAPSFRDPAVKAALNQCHCEAGTTDADIEDLVSISEFTIRRRCKSFHDKYVLYGTIGAGSFGNILAAYTRNPKPGQKPSLVAAKVIRVDPKRTVQLFPGITHDEAVNLWFWKGGEHLVQFHECYIHGDYAILVMEQFAIDKTPDFTADDITRRDMPMFPAFTGSHFTRSQWQRHQGIPVLSKWPKLNEGRACKVAFGLLYALLEMADRQAFHGDISVNNYLVDRSLNVKLIDSDSQMISPAVYDTKFFLHMERDMFTPPEYLRQLLPMTAGDVYRTKGRCRDRSFLRVMDKYDSSVCLKLKEAIDVSAVQNYSYAALIFELVHGTFPFEDPKEACYPRFDHKPSRNFEAEEGSGKRKFNNCMRRRWHRYNRVLQQELYLKKDLSQDAADVFNATLAYDVEQRPSVTELATFPWFSGWNHDERRPLNRAHIERYR